VNMNGGILQTPFFEVDGTTDDPFNVAMSFGVAGHYINIENFLRDFASDVFPRVHHMTASAIDHTTDARPANEFLYDDPRVCRRNLLIMPCDDGLFVPNYDLLALESLKTKMVGDDGIEDLSVINLDNMLTPESSLFGTSFGDVEGAALGSANNFVDDMIGFTPENPGTPPGSAYVGFMRNVDKLIAAGNYGPGVQAGAPLTIYQRTLDPSSNQVTFFDVSNLFYGKRIMPNSITLRDCNMTGSNGVVGITLKDDGFGNIYRADSLTSASSWNSVGNVFYDEGIIVIKSPHLFFFGKEQFEIDLRGEQGVHVMKLSVIARQNQLNSSSNPNYKSLPASGFVADVDKDFVYITGVQFLDENLNCVMKTQLAQPIVKRFGSRIMFKVSIDF